ncbi:MAG TPA: response regulator [Ktedonobacterales bacterium]
MMDHDDNPRSHDDDQPAGDSPGSAGLTDDEQAVLAAFQARGPRPSAWRPPVVPTPPVPANGESLEGDAERDMSAWRMPAADELDYIPPEMMRAFAAEASEALEGLRTWTLRFEREGARDDALELGRIAHQIKGTAATMGFGVLADLMLIYEDVTKAALRRSGQDQGATARTLLAMLDPIEQAILAARAEREADPALVAAARQLREEWAAATGGNDPYPGALAGAGTWDPAASSVGETLAELARDTDAEETMPLPIARVEAPLRVDPRRLDALMAHVSGLTLGRGALLRARDDLALLYAEFEQMVARVSTLVDQLADTRPAPPQPQHPIATSTEEDARRGGLGRRFFGRSGSQPVQQGGQGLGERGGGTTDLERFTELDQTVIALREAVDDLVTTGRTLRDGLRQLGRVGSDQAVTAQVIQDDVLHIRLVPFGDLVPRVEVEARRLARALGKAITFTVGGELTELDRNISDGLAEPLRQLVRNAVVHGIELPAERLEEGKPPIGSVWLRAEHRGSEVVIEVGDDGCGVNPHRMAAAALAQGLLDLEQARSLSLTQALDLMFLPGITTGPDASVHSGRGMGLDDVRTAIERLRGSISARRDPRGGTVFRIRVPISLSAVQALVVRAGGYGYTLPFASVASTAALQPSELLVRVERDETGREQRHMRIRVAPRQVVETPGELPESAQTWEEIPAVPLAELLGFAQELLDPQPALVVEAGSRRAALLVDATLEQHDVVVQALPAHLRRRVVRGATVTPDGELLWLLDPTELLSDLATGRYDQRPRLRPAADARDDTLAPTVLVVDDSVSIRHTLEQTLTRAGFAVQLARDGIEALDLMLVRPPRALLLDIEMPRLDGFELLAIMRETPPLAAVPVAMLTSRAAPRHQTRARELGAAAYLIKPCPQETLIETVQALIAAPVTQG